MDAPEPTTDDRSAPGPVSPMAGLERLRSRTPARVLIGRAGASYRTETYLGLRRDHAHARDAVLEEFDLERAWGAEFVREWGLFEVATRAATRAEYLARPDLGRALAPSARDRLIELCPLETDLQVVLADGLSAPALRAQVPSLLPLLASEAAARGWRFGRPFFIRHGRVGTLNDIGEILRPTVVVLLIGERPGLATAESLSAYMAYRPRSGHDDSKRNLISNIHVNGVLTDEAAMRVARLAEQMIERSTSGVNIKEQTGPDAGALATRAHAPDALEGREQIASGAV